MSDKYQPVVRLSGHERTWLEWDQKGSTHKVVPVDALVIEKVGGEWPEWAYAAAQQENEEGDDETRQPEVVVRAWMGWVLDALAADERSG